ncbi:SDR family NAD(P)-dependent oxidoreductase [Marinicauda pacifica]|jgi:3-oxoacyl-[acyl-carrier protein] reductase|uniref:SDR family NAD(P)-dependent oxidoreductase n=1 Tax=Marinicauda pacifica TaxID=1133559 RepID=UPI0035C85F8C
MTDLASGLTGQTIFVTGSSRGTGAAIARTLASHGARVVLHFSASPDKARSLASELGEACAGMVQADFAEPGAAPQAWREATRIAGGRLNGLVVNHGIFDASPALEDYDTWRTSWARVLEVDLQSAVDLMREAANAFVDTGTPGALVAVASRAAHRGDDAEHPAYAAAKAGLIATVKTFARAWSGRGLLAYAISPGWIDTEMAPQGKDARARALAEVPLGAMAAPEEIGRLTAFLLSGACPSATGATFDVNGASYVR